MLFRSTGISVGITIITVNSSSSTISSTSGGKTVTAGVSVNLSYKIEDQQTAIFLASLAANSSYSLEESLVLNEILKRNEGDISNAELEELGVKYSDSKFGGTAHNLEMAYDLSTKGYTVGEAAGEYLYQKQDIITKGFGAKVSISGPLGPRIQSSRSPVKKSA